MTKQVSTQVFFDSDWLRLGIERETGMPFNEYIVTVLMENKDGSGKCWFAARGLTLHAAMAKCEFNIAANMIHVREEKAKEKEGQKLDDIF